MQVLGKNEWKTDKGNILSGKEMDFLTFNDGTKFVKLPVEGIKSKDGRFGDLVVFGKHLKWSNGSPLSVDEVDLVKTEISSVFDAIKHYYIIQT